MRYRAVDCRVWTDARFLSLSAEARLLWLFLLTTPTSLPISGVIIGGPAALAEQLGWTTQRFHERFEELLTKGLRVRADFEARVVWLPNALRYWPPENPNQIVGWAKTWDDVPECDLKHEIWCALRDSCARWPEPFAKGFQEPFRKPLAEGCRNQEQDKEQQQKNPPNPPSGGTARSRRKPRPSEPTDVERASAKNVLASLGRYSGVEYQGRDSHVALITARLRDGRTELELRKVAWYCAVKRDWKNDPKMRAYLRPETLFGPKNIEKYLDAALTEYRNEHKTDEDVRGKQQALLAPAPRAPYQLAPAAEDLFAEETA